MRTCKLSKAWSCQAGLTTTVLDEAVVEEAQPLKCSSNFWDLACSLAYCLSSLRLLFGVSFFLFSVNANIL
jgi:hypothetical protein